MTNVLKMLTLNLHYDQAGFGPWPRRRAQIQTLLENEKPHIVALQAVHASETLDQAEDLARAGHYAHKLFLATTESIPHQGSAILANIPLSAPWSYALPRCDQDEDPSFRRAIAATFAWCGEVWQFTNAHFSWIGTQNLAQAQTLAMALEAFPGPQCLVGDLHAPSGSAAALHLKNLAWIDSLEKAVRNHDNGPNAPTHTPESRIDSILVKEVDEARIREVRVLTEPGAPLSDHRAVLLTLQPPTHEAKKKTHIPVGPQVRSTDTLKLGV